MSDRVRLASIGLGRWAQVLAAAAQRGDVIELYSCFTRLEDRRRAFQDEFDVPNAAGTLDELLEDEGVEGVIITTPNDTHRELIVAALEAGKAVYTDKPVTHTLEDAAVVRRAVQGSDQPFAVGHSARRLAGSRMMKQWIEDGSLGDVSLAEANFSNERGLELSPDTWRWYADQSPGGAFIQLGVHHADTLQYLLGPVARVTAQVRSLYTKAEVPDAIMAILEFEAGQLGYIGCGWASPGIFQIRLQGTEANLLYDLDFTHWAESHEADEWSTLASQRYRDMTRHPVALPPTDMFREQLDEFALAIRGEAEVEVGIDESIRALAVVHAALESSDRGGEAVELVPLLEEMDY